jgi:hypothetical protein
VLSKLDLKDFRDPNGTAVRPYQMPFPIAARVFRQTETQGFTQGQPMRQIQIEQPAGSLGARRCDDAAVPESTRHQLEAAVDTRGNRSSLDSLDSTIVKARLTMTFRRGRQVVVRNFEIPVECLQQAD